MQLMCNTSSANHAQHVMFHAVLWNSSATKFERVEITFVLGLFYGLKPLTDGGGEETRVP